jgi:hypothetical protein
VKKSAFKTLKLNTFLNKRLYVDQTRGNFSKIREFLNTIEILEYNSIVDGIKEYVDSGSKIWISPESSYYIYNSITNKVFFFRLI